MELEGRKELVDTTELVGEGTLDMNGEGHQ